MLPSTQVAPGGRTGGTPKVIAATTASVTPWPLPTSVLERRRAARELDRLLGVDDYPDVETTYPPVSLREVVAA